MLNFETPDVLGGGRTVHFLPAWKAHQKYVSMGRGETTWHSVVKAIVLNCVYRTKEIRAGELQSFLYTERVVN